MAQLHGCRITLFNIIGVFVNVMPQTHTYSRLSRNNIIIITIMDNALSQP